MTYIFPAIRGKMGSTVYYQANIAAGELAAIAKTAGQLEDWKNWSIFERFQREIATRRVQQEIVPYLVKTRDRFFGALIVLVYQAETFEFESLDSMSVQVAGAYREAAGSMGFLTIRGGDLVVLDGQHRLSALRGVVTAGDELEGEFRDDVVTDQLCVIFVGHDSFEKTRRIFNKVNRYAKPTTDSDNILTSEDDGSAIVSRWLVEDAPPLGLASPAPPFAKYKDVTGEPLVEWRSNQLPLSAYRITTLTTIYSTVRTILEAHGIKNFDEKHRVNRPTDRELANAYQVSSTWWTAVLNSFKVFEQARRRPGDIPELRGYHEGQSLLLTPAGQQALFLGLSSATKRGASLDVCLERAKRLEWRRSDQLWVATIVYASGQMNARERSLRLASRLVDYRLAGDLWSDEERNSLLLDLRTEKDNWSFRLPRAPR